MKIQLIAHARSGSTYVYEILHNTLEVRKPGMFMVNEPFNMPHLSQIKISPNEKDFLLQQQLEKCVKLPYVFQKSHIQHYRFLSAAQMELFKSVEWYNIFLYRRDLFESTMSQVISDKTNMWIRYNELPNKPIITSREFARILKVQIEAREELFAMKNVRPDEILIYEDLTFNQKKDYSKIELSKEIGRYAKGDPIVQKAPPKDELVENYDQLLDQYYKIIKGKTFENFDLDGKMITATRLEETK